MSEHAHEPGPNQIKRRRLTTVTVERPRCPTCGGVKLRKYRSIADQGDGSGSTWTRDVPPIYAVMSYAGRRFGLHSPTSEARA